MVDPHRPYRHRDHGAWCGMGSRGPGRCGDAGLRAVHRAAHPVLPHPVRHRSDPSADRTEGQHCGALLLSSSPVYRPTLLALSRRRKLQATCWFAATGSPVPGYREPKRPRVMLNLFPLVNNLPCGQGRHRSVDLRFFRPALYRLSYLTEQPGSYDPGFAGTTGFEPATSGLTGRRTLQTVLRALRTHPRLRAETEVYLRQPTLLN